MNIHALMSAAVANISKSSSSRGDVMSMLIRLAYRWYRGYLAHRSFRRDRDISILLHADDRLLRDIGISRYDLPFMARGKPPRPRLNHRT